MANRYWVGGTGTWDASTTTNWSATSGGAGGASAPTSVDDVFFDALSTVAPFTVTIGTGAVCRDVTVGTLAFEMTLAGSAAWIIYGSLTFPATNFTRTYTGSITFAATTTGKTITTNGVTIQSNINFNGIGGEWSLTGALTNVSAYSVSNGSFNTNGYNLYGNNIGSTGAGVRVIDLSSSIVTLIGSAAINFSTTSNLTFNAGTSLIECAGASTSLAGAGLTFYNVSFTSTAAGTATITGANTFNDLTFTSLAATGIRNIAIGANQTVNGTLTLGTANTPIRRIYMLSNAIEAPYTITAAAIATLADVDFKNIVAAGASGTWAGTRLGNSLGNSNITFDAGKNVYRRGTGNWSDTQWSLTSGGAVDVNAFPLAQDNAIYDANSTAGTTNLNTSTWLVGDLNLSDITSGITLSSAVGLSIHKNLILNTLVTFSGTSGLNFVGQGLPQQITSAGVTFTTAFNIIQSNFGSVQLQDALTTLAAFGLTSGTLDLNNFDLTCLTFSSNNANMRSIAFGSNAINVTGNNATIFGTSIITNFSYTGTPSFNFTYSGSVGTRNINAPTSGGTESNVFNLNITAGTDIVSIIDTSVIRNLNFTGFSGTANTLRHAIYGNLTISSGMTITGGSTGYTFLKSSGTQTLTTNGKTLDFPITKSGAGILQLLDDLTLGSTRTLIHTAGTIDCNDLTLTTGRYTSTGTTARQLDVGTGTLAVQDNFTASGSNFTTSGTGKISMDSASAKTFAGGGFSYQTLIQGGAGELLITGANTFAELSNSVQPATITFPIATTTIGKWSVKGTAGNLITLQRTGASGVFTLAYTGSSNITSDYLSISNSTGSAANTWYAGANSVDGGGNTNWNFSYGNVRYWVGGTGTWDASTATNWAYLSGYAGGALAPTSADDVFFDANSNTGTNPFTVTVTGTTASPAVCRDFTASGLDGALTLTMGGTAVLNCYGSITLPNSNFTAATSAGGSSINFLATTTGKTVTQNGVSFGAITTIFNGVGGEWTLGSALSTAGNITLTAGTFITNNFNVTCTTFTLSANANSKDVTLGSSTVTLGTNFTNSSTNNLTFNAGTSQITCNGASPTFAGGGLTFYNVTFASTAAGNTAILGVNTFNNLTFTSRAATSTRYIDFFANQTINDVLTLGVANAAIRRLAVRSGSVGVPATITLNGSLATLADVDFRDIVATGTAGTWSGTRLGNGGGNSNITFDAGKTVYWNLAAGGDWAATAWALTSGGAANVNNFPLLQDTAIIENTGLNTSATISAGTVWGTGSVDLSTRTNAMTLSIANIFYGNLTLSSAVTLPGGTGSQTFSGAGTQTITTAGVTVNQPIAINKPASTSLLLGDAVILESSRSVVLAQGTLDLNGFNLTCGLFSSSVTNIRSIAFGTGEINLTASGVTLNMATATGFTYTGTPTINLTYSGTSNTDVNFGPTGATESNVLDINHTSGTYSTNMSGHFRNVDFTGFAGLLQSISRTFYGNLIISTGMTTPSGTAINSFAKSSGTQTITANGKTLDFPIIKQGAGTLQLLDNLTQGATRAFTFTAGGIDLNGNDLTVGTLSSTGALARNINHGAGGELHVLGATFTASGSNLTTSGSGSISMDSASAKTFAGGGFGYQTLNQGGAGTLNITGANTFADITNTVQPCTITFPAGQTTSVQDFSVSGTAGNLVTVNSSTPGTQWTIAKV